MSKVIIAIGFLVLLLGQQTLNNDSIVNLMKAGFSEYRLRRKVEQRAKTAPSTAKAALILWLLRTA